MITSAADQWRSARAFIVTNEGCQGAAAVAGAAAGSDAIRGFPTIWAQEINDIELRHVGVSYSVVKAIGDQAAKDLGFKVTMQNLDTDRPVPALRRAVLAPAAGRSALHGSRAPAVERCWHTEYRLSAVSALMRCTRIRKDEQYGKDVTDAT
jgi:hypothetical protein